MASSVPLPGAVDPPSKDELMTCMPAEPVNWAMFAPV
jgi:hypothetical protein